MPFDIADPLMLENDDDDIRRVAFRALESGASSVYCSASPFIRTSGCRRP